MIGRDHHVHTLLVLQKSFTSYFLFIFSGKKSFKFCADAMSTWYSIEGTFEGVAEVISSLGAVVNYMQSAVDQSVLAKRGCPRIAIDSNQHVISSFQVRDVALIIRCSKRTIERQMNELGLQNELDYGMS